MDFTNLKQLDKTYIAGTYARNDIGILQGAGTHCTDVEGQPMLDFSAGIGVSSVGYGHPVWVAAVKDQIDRLAHMSNLYYTEPMANLAKALCQRTGMRKVFFGNSGAEANECALKVARKYMSDRYPGKRDTILTLVNSFHGRTIATLAATGQERFHAHFGPFPEGFVYAEAGNIADLHAKATERVGAVFIECVQGEGGVIPLDKAFVDAVAALCAQRDILLMVDEVQTGVGRTGTFLCLEQYGIAPDVITLAKGLAGGLPIGAALLGEKVASTLGPGDHGSTFGGNPICCAGALAVLQVMDQAFLDRVSETGQYLMNQLSALPGVIGVSGQGMMLGVELREGLKNTDVVASCLKKGLILLTAKHKVRLLPPLVLTVPEAERGLNIMREVLLELSGTSQTT